MTKKEWMDIAKRAGWNFPGKSDPEFRPDENAIVLKEELNRNTKGVACPKCNGYAEEVESTEEEIHSDLNCGRSWACCCRAFVCRICKTRIVGSAESPEME
jgi:hypothetical protein